MLISQLSSRNLSRTFAGLLGASVVVLTGCGIGPLSTASEPVSAGTISGAVHGGNLPVYNATVNLYEAGYTGYGSSGSKLATTTTDTTGHFQFTKNSGTGTPGGTTSTWQCDSSYPNAQIYIIASGGNTQGTGTTNTNNSAAVFLAALGQCTGISTGTTVILNELNTAATVYSLANYINPGTTAGTERIGTSSTTQGATGLNNAVSGIVNLATYAVGSTSSITAPTYTGTNATVTGITVTATADEPKLVTVANVLAACVNSTTAASNACVDLFANATAPTASTTSQPSVTFPTAVDTLQAMYYLATNPGLNGTAPTTCNNTGAAATKAACLYGLATATGAPFQTGMGSAPTDYSMNVIYSATGTCTGGNSFIAGPYHEAIDASGNIWVINGSGSTTNLAEMSPIGLPLGCFGPLSNGRGMTIDVNGNVWVSFNGVTSNGTTLSGIQVLPSGGSAFTNVPTPNTQQTYEITSDGFGNIFYSVNANGGSVWEIVNGANNTVTPPTPVSIASGFNGTSTTTQGYIQVDSLGRIWDATSTVQFMYGIYPTAASQGTISAVTTNGTTATFTTSAGPWASAAGSQVQISGLTTTTGKNFNFGTYTILASPAPTATSFAVASTVATATATDSGTAMLPGLSGAATGTSSYAFTANATPSASSYGMTIDSSGNLYQGTTCCGSGAPSRTATKWYTNSSANSGTATFANNGTTNFAGINGVRSVVVDGASNVFFGNEYPNGPTATTGTAPTVTETTTGNWGISEITTSGTSSSTTFTALSPSGATPPTCSTTYGCATLGGYFDSLGTTTGTSKITGLPLDLQVDPSGNLWAPQSGDASTTTDGVALLEMVGGAVPVVTPLSIATKNGTLGTKP